MPALPLKEAFTARAIKVMWDSYKETQGIAPYLGSGFFPAEKTPTMDLKWFKGSKGLPVLLTPSNYDAQEYENLMNATDPAVAQQILKQIALALLTLFRVQTLYQSV